MELPSKRAFDYIVVGAGSAGCVLANRLSAHKGVEVALVEPGPTDKSLLVSTPSMLGWILPISRTYNWRFWSTPQKNLNGRSLFLPRGRGLGGSSSINAMIYIRGQREDYDDWAALGNTGWEYESVLPVFKRLEDNCRGASEYHGVGGELHVNEGADPGRMGRDLVEAMEELGCPKNDDFNGRRQIGSGFYQFTMKNGRRWNSASAFLHPIIDERKNLTVMTSTRATKILVEGKRAVGVEIASEFDRKNPHGCEKVELRASRGVAVASGAYNSPQLLMLSGIGPREKIAQAGIDVVHHLPGVGQNLQDHLDIGVVASTHLLEEILMWHPSNMLTQARHIVRFMQGHADTFMSAVSCEPGAFVPYADQPSRAQFQLHLERLPSQPHGFGFRLGQGVSLHSCLLHPHSAGSVTLRDNNPFSPPSIDHNYLSDPRDLDEMVQSVKLLIEVLKTKALERYKWQRPSIPLDASNEAIVEYIRRYAETIYHPTSTCKMGVESDPMAVVDPVGLKVYGMDNLRVVDASVMPNVLGGNTNAPTMMIADKTAEVIAQQDGLTV